MSNSRRQRVFRAFEETARRFRMIEPGDHILAACSGGPDSVALVSLLLELRGEMPLEITVAHFNHRLRAAASAADEAFVRDMARRWVLPFVRGAGDVRGFAARKKVNLEEAARTMRYAFLRKAARKAHASKIATGHTMNDQAETVLMRVLRGTGLAGLGGIEPLRREGAVPVVRPLLGMARQEIEAYLTAKGIPSRADASNLDPRFLRNRIRLRLLPLLEAEFDPRIVRHLARLADMAREDEDLLRGFVSELADEFIREKGRDLSLDAKTLGLVPTGLARRVLREFLLRLKGDLRAVSFEDVETVLRLGEGKETTVKKGLALVRRNGRVFPKRPGTVPTEFERRWSGKGPLILKEAGMAFKGKVTDAGAKEPRRRPGRPSGFAGDPSKPVLGKSRGRLEYEDKTRVFLDADRLTFPLTVRNRRPGDLYRPIGAPGRKKLKELMRARGIPLPARDRLPVFLSGGDVVWAPGLPAGEAFKVRPDTARIFVILLEKAGRPLIPPGGKVSRRG